LGALTISYFVYYSSVLYFPTWSKVGFFLFYYGVAFESILMTLALIEHFKQIQVTALHRDEVNVVLEQKVEARTEELNMFLYSASHDLRGPLKSIEGLCKLAQVDDSIPRDQVLSMVLKKISSLENYVNDLNAVTKIKSNTTQIKEIDFEAIHYRLVDQFSSYDRMQQIDIVLNVIPTGISFYFDEFSLRIIYQNILENAIKYSDNNKEKSYIHVLIHVKEDHVELVFEDNGIGIPDTILPKIFVMFYRGNENSKDDTGLGLYIVKLIIEKWKGSIEVASEQNEGTTFTIVLPNKKPNP
jgi:signal transduction histidine kinase